MPRIKRYFKVSQDINVDPKCWELTDRFGLSGLRTWLEILSIADRNEGTLPGPWKDYCKLLAGRVRSTWRHLQAVLKWLSSESQDGQEGSRCWVEVNSKGIANIPKWSEYNRLREANKIPRGELSASSPILSSPNLTLPIKKKSKIRVAPPAEAVELAQILSDKIAENIPNQTLPTESRLTAWAWEAEKINRIDRHPWNEIRDLIRWCQADPFWKSNILSMQKLRKQWNQLLAKKMQGSQGDKTAQARQRTAEILTRGIK